jgi:fibro-slime domain-containing protein
MRRPSSTVSILASVCVSLLALAGCDADKNGNGDDDTGGHGDAGNGFADASDGDGGGQPNGDGGTLCGQLPVTLRDFKADHPDFEEPDSHSDVSTPGIVAVDLGTDGKPVYLPTAPVAPNQFSTKANFDQWYRDVPGVNQPFPYTITLSDLGNGKFGFSSNAFFPLDGQGFGNEGRPHNFHFTTELHTTFEYKGGETFKFTGDDDLWLFINGKLAIDLGGMHPQLSKEVNLDQSAGTLGISVGGTYKMDIFHAERHTDESNFSIETTIDCFIVE